VGTVVEQMGDVYPELCERSPVVTTQLRQEEERFARTLNVGTDIAGRELERVKRAGGSVFPGRLAFRLYETHGLSVDLLEEFAQEEGLALDREGFDSALEEAREAGKRGWKGDLLARFRPEYEDLAERGLRSDFLGYDHLEVEARVVALLDGTGEVDELAAGGEGEAVLDRTSFYAESGGQVGDRGELVWGEGSATVLDAQKPIEGLTVHRLRVEQGTLRVGDPVQARVTEGPRRDTQRNHTATHLLHAALRGVLGPAAQQAGSLVDPDRLRFDFSWGEPVGAEALEEIERRVNAEVVRNHSVAKQFMTLDAARELGAMALFGEKYGDTVRVVSIGDGGVSRELCGGCHVQRTGDIGFFKVVVERGVAAGVRRIEAVTGRGAVAYAQELARRAQQLAGRYQTSFEQLPELLGRRDQQLEKLEEEVRALKHRLASGDVGGGEVRREVAGVTLVARRAPEMSPSELRNLADTLRQRIGSGVVVLGMESEGKATLLVAVTDDLVGRVHAGNLVKELAQVVGGRGGGKANLAQAGGPDAGRLDEALERAAAVLGSQLGQS
jgi:alanyl-tRNA synthetase